MIDANRASDYSPLEPGAHRIVAEELDSIARAAIQLGGRLHRLAATLADPPRFERRVDVAACLVLAQDAIDLADLTGGTREAALAESLWRVLEQRDGV